MKKMTWYQKRLQQVRENNSYEENDLMELQYLLTITQENGYWKGREITEESFNQLISREVKKKKRKERAKQYEEKHPLILELEKEVKEYNENRGMYEEMLDEEDFLEDFKNEYGEQWNKVWKKEKERRLKKELYSMVDDEKNMYQIKLFIQGHLLTEDQRELLMKSQRKLQEVLEEKSSLYEKFRIEWNERLGEEYFPPSEKKKKIIPKIKQPIHVLDDQKIQEKMGIAYEKHHLIVLFEKECEVLNHKYPKEEVKIYVEKTFEETYGQAWINAKEQERKRTLKINYYRYSNDEQGKQYFIYTYLFTKEQKQYVQKFGMNFEEVMEEKGALYNQLKKEWEQEVEEMLS